MDNHMILTYTTVFSNSLLQSDNLELYLTIIFLQFVLYLDEYIQMKNIEILQYLKVTCNIILIEILTILLEFISKTHSETFSDFLTLKIYHQIFSSEDMLKLLFISPVQILLHFEKIIKNYLVALLIALLCHIIYIFGKCIPMYFTAGKQQEWPSYFQTFGKNKNKLFKHRQFEKLEQSIFTTNVPFKVLIKFKTTIILHRNC